MRKRRMILTVLVSAIMVFSSVQNAFARAIACDYCNGSYRGIREVYYQDIRSETKDVGNIRYIRYLVEYTDYMLCSNNRTIGHYMYRVERWSDWQIFYIL